MVDGEFEFKRQEINPGFNPILNKIEIRHFFLDFLHRQAHLFMDCLGAGMFFGRNTIWRRDSDDVTAIPFRVEPFGDSILHGAHPCL